MKKLLSWLVVFVCLFAFSGLSNAATSSILGQSNEVITSTALSSLVSNISPNINKIKLSLSPATLNKMLGKVTVVEKRTLIYEETGLKLYIGAALKNYKPLVKLIFVLDNRVIAEGKPDTMSGTLSFNVGYRWDGYVTLALDSEYQDLIIYSADLGTLKLELQDVTVAIGVLPHNEGTVKVDGIVGINGVPVDIGALSTVIDILSKQM